MSLLEILLALGMMGIIMTTLYATYSNSLSIIKSTRDKALESRRRMILYKIIETDLQNIFYPRNKKTQNFKAQKRSKGNDNADGLSFISVSSGLSHVSKVGNLRGIEYFVKEGGADATGRSLLALYKREKIGVDETPEKGGHISLLEGGIISFTVECAGSLGKIEWNRGWDNNISGKYPVAVKITIQFPMQNQPDQSRELIILGQVKQQKINAF